MNVKAARREADDYDDDDDLDYDAQLNKYLTFPIGDEEFGIAIANVIEIVGIPKITKVPDMPDFVKGVINLRGTIIPLIDTRMRFNIGTRDYDDRTCVIVVDIGALTVGIVVDTVKEVLTIPEENVSAPPGFRRGISGRYIKGMGKVGESVKILLDLDRMLRAEELEELATHASAN